MKLITQPDDGVAPLLSAIQKARRCVDMAIFRFDRLVEDDLVGAAGRRAPIPGPVLSAGPERPPIDPVVVADRDRRFVLLKPALHLLVQGLDERCMRLHRRLEIGVLGLEIGEHVLVLDLGIEGILQPGIGILDRVAVAFVAIRARLGAGRV